MNGEKKFKGKLEIVILCAGEGIRFQEYSKKVPKSLIRIKTLNNSTILGHLIYNLVDFVNDKLIIVTGHLGSKIKRFIYKITKRDNQFINKLFLIDSGTQYKKGPLYSFLSITKYEKIYDKDIIYFVFPGDTLYDTDLIQEIFNISTKKLDIIQDSPIVFYQKVNSAALKSDYKDSIKIFPKVISVLETTKIEQINTLKDIFQKDLRFIPDNDIVNLTVPVFIFHYNFIEKIIKASKVAAVDTIRDIINFLINESNIILAFDIDPNLKFYDIDTKSDLENFIRKKKKSGQ